jgi:hypothetical protein
MNLPGRWALHRTIEDRRGQDVTASGVADFVGLSDGRVRWHESGTMHHARAEMTFTRTLYLKPVTDAAEGGEGWEVTFEDGRPFHPWPDPETVERHRSAAGASGDACTEGRARTSGTDFVHVCTPDLYRGVLVEPVGTDEWTLRWDVTGPRKDYVMTTRYTRL